MLIDLSPLHNAIDRLDFALKRHHREPADNEVRDSVIQRFEFTYDLCTKMLRRVLETTSDDVEAIEQMTFPTLIRTGWERGLVEGGWPVWHQFRKMRNITSHTYDEIKAIEVASQVPEFLGEARSLVVKLSERLVQ